jgi:predicted metal-dependent hydrolase
MGRKPIFSAMFVETRIIRSPKRKRTVALRVESDGTLTVQAPLRTSLGWIENFIREKARWISKRQASIKKRTMCPTFTIEEGSLIPFLGEHIPLRFERSATEQNPSNLVLLDIAPTLSKETRQAEIKTGLTLWYKKQARRVMPERINRWAAMIGVKPSRLFITNTRGRWGSCTAKNEIRISWRLVLASSEIVDYVIVHELCHIRHKNHGKNFWAMVHRYIPDARRLRLGLRSVEKSEIMAFLEP